MNQTVFQFSRQRGHPWLPSLNSTHTFNSPHLLLNSPFALSINLAFAMFSVSIIDLYWSKIMSKVCQVTGKKPARGYKYAIRGIAKKKKGIGLKVTGKTKRRFQPNLAKKRVWFPDENRFVTIRMAMSAMRTIDRVGIATVIRGMRARGEKV